MPTSTGSAGSGVASTDLTTAIGGGAATSSPLPFSFFQCASRASM
jgi:hypothetical protein